MVQREPFIFLQCRIYVTKFENDPHSIEFMGEQNLATLVSLIQLRFQFEDT